MISMGLISAEVLIEDDMPYLGFLLNLINNKVS